MALLNPKPTELPARKPIQAVERQDCYCTHSPEDHRGPAGLNERGGPCTLCRCEHYLRRPCVCSHLAGGHNGACLVKGCKCKAFRQDPTPEVLLRAGVRHDDIAVTTKGRMRFLQRPGIPVRIRIWATGMIHADRGRLAVRRDETGNIVPLRAEDIVRELNALDSIPCAINCRREFRALEQMGAMRRVLSPCVCSHSASSHKGAGICLVKGCDCKAFRQKGGNPRLFFYLKPLPNRLIQEEGEEKAQADRSVHPESVNGSNQSYLQNTIILPAKKALVNLFLKHLPEVVSNGVDRSVQIEHALEPVTELLKSVLEGLLRPPTANGDSVNVSNGPTTPPDGSVRPPKKNSDSNQENRPYKKRPSAQGEGSSSSEVKAEEDETPPQSLEPAPPSYRDFRSLYPKEKLDDAKARVAYNELAPLEKRFCFQGLLAHLTCERWVKSITNNQAKYVPLASNFIKRREYAGDPPPHIDITAELTPAERRQQQKAEQLAATARELYERELRRQQHK